jgi:chemotaxis protein CheZ
MRPFTAEIRRNAGALPALTASPSAAAFADPTSVRPGSDTWFIGEQILEAIAAIERRLDAALSGIAPGPLPSAPADVAAPAPARKMAVPTLGAQGSKGASDGAAEFDLRCELAELSTAIDQTKHEIAALRCNGQPPDPLETANNELDAVVRATESATESILSAAEQIDALVGGLRNKANNQDEAAFAEIAQLVISIFEACNFQDITGQRITKVVNTMKFIDARIESMIQILGGVEAFHEIVTTLEPVAEGDEALLHGPQLDEPGKISQDDVDKFFS